MSIELTNKHCESQYRINKTKSQCTNCNGKASILYNYENLPYRLCELCNIVHKYSVRTMESGIICKTNLSQIKIITMTRDFLKTNRRIPNITEIDPDAKLIDCPIPDLLEVMRNSSSKQKKYFSDFKLFFTDMINYNGFAFASMFWRPLKYKEYQFFEIVNESVPLISLNDEQKDILKLFI